MHPPRDACRTMACGQVKDRAATGAKAGRCIGRVARLGTLLRRFAKRCPFCERVVVPFLAVIVIGIEGIHRGGPTAHKRLGLKTCLIGTLLIQNLAVLSPRFDGVDQYDDYDHFDDDPTYQ